MAISIDPRYLKTGSASVYLREVGAGTIAVTASTTVTGTGTKFTSLSVGDKIIASGETHTVATITSDTALTTDAWTVTASGLTYSHDSNVGAIDEGLEVAVKTDTMKLTAAATGTAVVDEVVTGAEITIKVIFKEIKMESLKRACATSTTIVDDTTPTKRRWEVGPRNGLSLRSISKRLTIVPLVGGAETTNLEDIIVAPYAVPGAGTLKLMFSNNVQRTIEADFVCLPGLTVGKGLCCLFTGDETAIDVSAPIGIPGV